ncbi:uncharacterized protein [Euphorbia lathyris]|uniref:uncharacterized protein n=1 Tax=Euphorbia lathyris TaxID=212925 RepID=UPI003313C317
MFYKPTITTTKLPEKMAAATTPVAIGTRGTVGSLVRKEIDYFNKINDQVDICGSSRNKAHRTGFWSLKLSWKKKKRSGNSSRFIPSICSAVDHVEVTNRINGIHGFSYRILKDEVKEMIV